MRDRKRWGEWISIHRKNHWQIVSLFVKANPSQRGANEIDTHTDWLSEMKHCDVFDLHAYQWLAQLKRWPKCERWNKMRERKPLKRQLNRNGEKSVKKGGWWNGAQISELQTENLVDDVNNNKNETKHQHYSDRANIHIHHLNLTTSIAIQTPHIYIFVFAQHQAVNTKRNGRENNERKISIWFSICIVVVDVVGGGVIFSIFSPVLFGWRSVWLLFFSFKLLKFMTGSDC